MLSKEDSKKQAEKTRIALERVLEDVDVDNIEITCEECELNDNCEFAWDLYNTDGDCLAEK
jgi:hypothetical protein